MFRSNLLSILKHRCMVRKPSNSSFFTSFLLRTRSMKIWCKFWETKTVAESGIDEGSCGSARWDRGVNQIKLSGAQHSVTQRLVTLTRYHKNFCFLHLKPQSNQRQEWKVTKSQSVPCLRFRTMLIQGRSGRVCTV